MSKLSNRPFSFVNGLIVSVLVFLMIACKSMPMHSDDDLLFSMEKTSCFGNCPTYTLKVYQDGWAELIGTANVKYIGNYQLKLTDNQLADIKSSFEKHEFFSLEEKYYANVSDLPTTYLYYHDGTQSKKVMDYYGGPENLKQLEAYLGKLVEQKWKKSPN